MLGPIDEIFTDLEQIVGAVHQRILGDGPSFFRLTMRARKSLFLIRNHRMENRPIVLVLESHICNYPLDHWVLRLNDGVDLCPDYCLWWDSFDGVHFSAILVNPRFDLGWSSNGTGLGDVDVPDEIKEVRVLLMYCRFLCVFLVEDGN